MSHIASLRRLLGLTTLLGVLAGTGIAVTPRAGRADPPIGNYKCNGDLDGCLTGNYVCSVTCPAGGDCGCKNS